MIATGFILAGISVGGCYLVYRKFPKWVRGFMRRHPLFTDLTVAVTTYILFAGTVTGLVAAAWAGIIVSIMLALVSNPTTSNLLDRIASKLSELKQKIFDLADKHVPNEKPELKVVKGSHR